MEHYKLEGPWGCDDPSRRKWCKDMKERFDLKLVTKLGHMKIKITKKSELIQRFDIFQVWWDNSLYELNQ